MRNVEKWSNILQKYCNIHTKYVSSIFDHFFIIRHEWVKGLKILLRIRVTVINPLSANSVKWLNTLKQLSITADELLGLALKALT